MSSDGLPREADESFAFMQMLDAHIIDSIHKSARFAHLRAALLMASISPKQPPSSTLVTTFLFLQNGVACARPVHVKDCLFVLARVGEFVYSKQ